MDFGKITERKSSRALSLKSSLVRTHGNVSREKLDVVNEAETGVDGAVSEDLDL